MGLLKGKRVLVTGAATGIGRAIVMACAGEGATVAAHARSEDRIQPVLDEMDQAGYHVVPLFADLEKDTEIKQLADDTLSKLGGIDIVVNNAGYSEKAHLEETTDALWDRTMQVNLKAPFLLCRELVTAIKQNREGGRIIFNASVAAKLPDPAGSAYNSSKAGILGLMRCMAAELGEYRITVNAICPGWVDTPMARSLHEAMYEGSADGFDAFYRDSTSTNMLGGQIKPEDIAELAVYLASDKGRYITGQAINVCAGLCFAG